MNTRIKKVNKGFTLLEILLVIAAIGILAAIVLVAINPNRQIAQARNAQRRSDINTIYKALEQYLIDNKVYPTSINETKQDICIGTNTPANCISLDELVPTYLSSIPKDPSGGVYKVYKNSENNRIGVEAAGAELGQSLAVNPISSTPTPTPTAYAIGDTGPGGGKVFYVAGNTYLEAAPSNWSGGTDPGLTWSTGGNQTTVVSGADNSAIGGGFQNTVDIVNQAGNVAASSAAVRARNYTGGGMTDWFLPSKDELAALYAQRTTTGILTGVVYWSSSELSSTNAWLLWDNGVFVTNAGKDWTGRVRPIRMDVI